jgi:hypothetical protein
LRPQAAIEAISFAAVGKFQQAAHKYMAAQIAVIITEGAIKTDICFTFTK